MKLWNSYGAEHSANLVLIGTFKRAEDAETAAATIKAIADDCAEDRNRRRIDRNRYSKPILALMREHKISSISVAELEQFTYEHSIKVSDAKIIIKTEEVDVSGLIKLLIHRGARVEVFSAHDYPESPHGRGKG